MVLGSVPEGRQFCCGACRGRSGPGPGVEALQAFLAVVRFDEGDPRSVTAVVAVRLAAVLDERPEAVSVARELRGHLAALAEHSTEAANMVDDLRARRAARRVDSLIQSATPWGDR